MKRKVLASALIVIMLTSLQGCGLIKDTKESNGEGKTKVESALTEEKETKKDSKIDENIVQEKKNSVDVKEWAQAYADYISSWEKEDYYYYGFAYIDNDDVPEIVCFSTANDDTEILTYCNGQVKNTCLLYGGSVYYQNYSNNFILYFNDDDYVFLYSIENGEAIEQHRGRIFTRWDGEQDVKEYSWDGKDDYTEEEYFKKLDDTFNRSAQIGIMCDRENNTGSQTVDILNDLIRNQNPSLPKWKQAYYNYISIMYPEYPFQLVDLNNDNIPEVCVDLSCQNYTCDILSYYDGKIERISTLPFISYDKNGIYTSGGRPGGGGESIAIYEFKNGIAEQKVFGECYYEFDGENYSDEVTCTWNDKKVSEQEYNRLYKAALGNNKKQDIDYEKYKGKSEILSVLSSKY